MIIEFKISNGNMQIYVDTFFREATKASIRKMLKCFKDSGPDPEAVQELKDWLQGEIQDLKKGQTNPPLEYGIPNKTCRTLQGRPGNYRKIGFVREGTK